MTLKQLLNTYPEGAGNVLNNYTYGVFKGEELFQSRPWELPTNCITIYSFCYDNRRGIWINKFKDGGKVVCVQINAGREGDDACATLCLDKEWLQQLANRNGTSIHVSKYGSIKYLDSLDEDITDYVTKEVGGYGTPYDYNGRLIDEILKVV